MKTTIAAGIITATALLLLSCGGQDPLAIDGGQVHDLSLIDPGDGFRAAPVDETTRLNGHDCCSLGDVASGAPRAGCSDPMIRDCVCDILPACCEQAWGVSCIFQTVALCGNCNALDPAVVAVLQVDTDGDGVGDLDEIDMGTDPDDPFDNADTDGDGIPDRADIDLDGDGIPNLLDPDIDGDGISNDFDPDIDGDGLVNAVDGSALAGGCQSDDDCPLASDCVNAECLENGVCVYSDKPEDTACGDKLQDNECMTVGTCQTIQVQDGEGEEQFTCSDRVPGIRKDASCDTALDDGLCREAGAGQCNQAGVCVGTNNKPDSTPCGDGILNLAGQATCETRTCQEGVCTGDAVMLTGGEACDTALDDGLCREAGAGQCNQAGACVGTNNKQDGIPCGDGILNLAGQATCETRTCQEGECTGDAVALQDDEPCETAPNDPCRQAGAGQCNQAGACVGTNNKQDGIPCGDAIQNQEEQTTCEIKTCQDGACTGDAERLTNGEVCGTAPLDDPCRDASEATCNDNGECEGALKDQCFSEAFEGEGTCESGGECTCGGQPNCPQDAPVCKERAMCVQCTEDDHCEDGLPRCSDDNECVQCIEPDDCGLAQECTDNICMDP